MEKYGVQQFLDFAIKDLKLEEIDMDKIDLNEADSEIIGDLKYPGGDKDTKYAFNRFTYGDGDQKVIVKTLPIHDSIWKNTFYELEVLNKCKGEKGIIQIRGVGKDDNCIYLIYNDIEEGFYIEIDQDSKPENPKQLILDVADALITLNKKGYFFKEVNSLFIMKDKDEHAVLYDFTHSRSAAKDAGGVTVLPVNESPVFVCPEIVTATDYVEITEACDVWGLGCFAYHMLTGMQPYYSLDKKKNTPKAPVGFSVMITKNPPTKNIPESDDSAKIKKLVDDICVQDKSKRPSLVDCRKMIEAYFS